MSDRKANGKTAIQEVTITRAQAEGWARRYIQEQSANGVAPGSQDGWLKVSELGRVFVDNGQEINKAFENAVVKLIADFMAGKTPETIAAERHNLKQLVESHFRIFPQTYEHSDIGSIKKTIYLIDEKSLQLLEGLSVIGEKPETKAPKKAVKFELTILSTFVGERSRSKPDYAREYKQAATIIDHYKRELHSKLLAEAQEEFDSRSPNYEQKCRNRAIVRLSEWAGTVVTKNGNNRYGLTEKGQQWFDRIVECRQRGNRLNPDDKNISEVQKELDVPMPELLSYVQERKVKVDSATLRDGLPPSPKVYEHTSHAKFFNPEGVEEAREYFAEKAKPATQAGKVTARRAKAKDAAAGVDI